LPIHKEGSYDMGTVLAMILNKQSTFEKTSYHKHFTIRASKNTDMRLVTSQLFTLFQICDYVRSEGALLGWWFPWL